MEVVTKEANTRTRRDASINKVAYHDPDTVLPLIATSYKEESVPVPSASYCLTTTEWYCLGSLVSSRPD